MERARLGLLRLALLLLALSPHTVSTSIAQPTADPEPCNGAKAEVTGIITGPDGSPVNNAIIAYYGAHWASDCRTGTYETFEARSDSSGAYAIRVPLGKGRVLSVERTDAADFPREFIPLADVGPEGIRADHQFKLLHIQGTVVDASGTPIDGGTVAYYLKPTSAICGTGLPEVPIREGRFESVVHAPGTYVFWVRPGYGGVGVRSHPEHVAISADTSVAITAEAYRVEGVIVDPAGQPIEGATVAAEGSEYGQGRSDGNGRYRLILPEGRYRLSAFYPAGRVQLCEPESISVSGSLHIDLTAKGAPVAPPEGQDTR